MKFLKSLGLRWNGRQNYQWGLFECPHCKILLERTITRGKRQKLCLACSLIIPSKGNFKHGGTGTRLYKVWQDMKSRCLNPNDTSYQYYGGRGIKVCEEWNEFPSFQTWAKANGYSDNLTIDKIDNNGNYGPDNCQFITQGENVIKDQCTIDRSLYVKLRKDVSSGLTITQACQNHGLLYDCYRRAKRRFEDA